ncbi:MAG: SMI1/KNR4 family protein [Breznakibacter sp.]
MNLEFLKKYILPGESHSSSEEYKEFKHHFFRLDQEEIALAENEIKIPKELKEFFINVGYGFFFQRDNSSFDRLLDVISFKKVNLRQDYYEYDPDLDLYSHVKYKEKLIFFEVNEGVYLLIDKEAKNGKNAIYFFDKKIADSLEEFLLKFDLNPNLINEIE